MTKKAYIVPIDEAHFDLIAAQVEQLYAKDPFDFLFIGPTGFYTRQIADKVAQKVGKTLNRNAFLVINQYITELLLRSNYDVEILDRDFYTIYISKIIDELYDEAKNSEENIDSQRLLLLRTLSKSNTVVEYIVEIFEKLWELELYKEEVKTSEQYALVESIMKDESVFAQIIRDVLNNMKKVAKQLQSKNVYDPVSIYNWYVNNAKYVERQRKYLVLSGFFDISPLIQKALREVIEKSENVIFFVWQKIEDDAFKTIDEIYEFLENNGFQFDYSLCSEKHISTKKLFDKKDVFRVDTENTYFQYQYIVREVKKLLIDGTQPEDIGIVVPNTSIAQRVMEEFEEAKIPYRYSGKNALVDSQIVKILLQPLVTIENNYKSEDLLALIESPLISERTLTMDEIEQLFKEYNYFSINLTPSEMKDKEKRNQVYFENLDRDIAFLKEKLKENVFDESNEEEQEIDVLTMRKERLEKLENFKSIMESVLKILDEIHENRKNEVNFFEWYRGFIKSSISKFSHLFDKLDNSTPTVAITRSIGKELNAFTKFIEVLDRLEMYVRKLKESNVVKELKSWDKIFKFFQVLLNASGYRDTFKSASVVDIIDLSTARFVSKKYKFFLEFTDDYYPSINKINPLLYRTNNERSVIYDVLENNERRTTILAIVFSNQAKLIFPRATNTGEEIVASKYITEFTKQFEQAKFTPNDIFKEIDYKIYKLRNSIEQKLTLRPTDFIVGKTNITDFSHSKLSTYLSCPLQFYYSSIAGISKPTRFSEKLAINQGLIVHRVLKRFFENPIGFEVNEEDIKKWAKEEYDAIFSEGIWKYSVPREMTVNEITKSLMPLLQDFVKSRRIIDLGAKSFTINSSKKGVAQLTSANTIALEKEFRTTLGKYTIITRVDRIDKVQDNYSAEDEKTLIDKQAYAIIDYKYSKRSVENAQIEQLLLYDYALSRSQNDIYPKDKPSDFYLILFATKREKESYSYSYLKKETGELQTYIFKIKPKGKGKKITENRAINIDEFVNWLKNLLDEISESGNFVPVFIDARSKSFVSNISQYIPEEYEIDVPKGSKQTRKCRVYNNNCQYEPLCSMYEIYGLKLI